ncbi:hypothetical protein FE840_013810 [Peteryoungia desertarenae]|uniref:Uncharacterized protein n=1 Tax=Peteryoungia desertarenae TaxID=1813451 RepID=A0ABX6QPI9_9HYPH|nr:hypothetical protein [Peteryoungia desertarenae]QLF70523.1 hypothetical protein FE840_013810 [Peteryoungia desertarenae]
MDGPEHVCQTLEKECEAAGIEHRYKDVGTDAGYYAWHFYFRYPAELMLGGNIEHRRLWVELQFTTQLAEVITILTHQLYEERRSGRNHGVGSKWKWDATSNRFRSAYLGHGLHLLEGIIQGLKDDLVAPPKRDEEKPEGNDKAVAFEADAQDFVEVD